MYMYLRPRPRRIPQIHHRLPRLEETVSIIDLQEFECGSAFQTLHFGLARESVFALPVDPAFGGCETEGQSLRGGVGLARWMGGEVEGRCEGSCWCYIVAEESAGAG